MRAFFCCLALGMIVCLAGGVAAASGPTSPVLLQSDPADGAKLARSPEQITLTFNQPLDAHYTRIEVYACGKRVDSTDTTVTLSQISAPIVKGFAGTHTVYYFANGTPKGATGETTGLFTFRVKKGKACR